MINADVIYNIVRQIKGKRFNANLKKLTQKTGRFTDAKDPLQQP
jgi:hypothetical protein